MGRQIAGGVVAGDGLLHAHHDRVGETAQQHDDREDDVHDANALVIDRGDPLAPQVAPLARDRDRGEEGEAEERHDGARAHDDGLVPGNGIEREFSEHV